MTLDVASDEALGDTRNNNSMNGAFVLDGNKLRIAYIDAAIIDNKGHHANSCRYFISEFSRRGFVVDSYGSRMLTPRLAEELKIRPSFRHYPYWRVRESGPLSHGDLPYLIERSSFLYDLRMAWRRGPYEILVFPFVLAAQFGAISAWLRGFNRDQAPVVAVGFDTSSGNELTGDYAYYTPYYRRIGRTFRRKYLQRTLLFSHESATARDYATVMNLPVRAMPAIHAGFGRPRLRGKGADRRVTIGFLGHQRPEKGFQFIPDIIEYLQSRSLPVKVLVHNSGPADDDVSERLRLLSKANSPMVEFVESAGDHLEWQGLLDRCDLMVLPYEPNRYRNSGSGLATEAVGSGIPMVVPAGTTMEQLAIRYQGGSVSFANWSAQEVGRAIEAAIADFDVLAERARTGAEEWLSVNGAGHFVDQLMAIDARSMAAFPRRRGSRCSSAYDQCVGRVLDRLVLGRWRA